MSTNSKWYIHPVSIIHMTGRSISSGGRSRHNCTLLDFFPMKVSNKLYSEWKVQTVVPFGRGQWLEGVRGYLRAQHQGCWIKACLCGVRQLASHKMLLARHSNVQTYRKSVWLLASTWLSESVYFLMLIYKENMLLNSKDNCISSNYAKCGDSH